MKQPTATTTAAAALFLALAACGPENRSAGGPEHESWYEVPPGPGETIHARPCKRLNQAARRMNKTLDRIDAEQPEPYEWGRRCALMQDGRNDMARIMDSENPDCTQIYETVKRFMLTCNSENHAAYTSKAYCERKEFDRLFGDECDLRNRVRERFEANMSRKRPDPGYPDGTY